MNWTDIDEPSLDRIAAALAAQLPAEGLVVHLEGNLGAGKTRFVRGLLHALGHEGPVRSPTYTLIEPYRLNGRDIFHLDLYRVADPDELEFIGLRDLLSPGALVLIEWAAKGQGVLPLPDLVLGLKTTAPTLRDVTARACSKTGNRVLESM